MRKSAVYSWRLSPVTRDLLEEAARRERASVAGLLDRIVADYLRRGPTPASDEDEEQRRLHAAAARAIGTLAGQDPRRAERARIAIRARLGRRRGR
jgi:hypothetical protein